MKARAPAPPNDTDRSGSNQSLGTGRNRRHDYVMRLTRPVRGELLILAGNTSVAESCASFT
jgi:hypothetical protein